MKKVMTIQGKIVYKEDDDDIANMLENTNDKLDTGNYQIRV